MEMDKPTISVDENDWPVSAAWAAMKKPLFTSGIGDFVSVKVNSFAPRWGLSDEDWDLLHHVRVRTLLRLGTAPLRTALAG